MAAANSTNEEPRPPERDARSKTGARDIIVMGGSAGSIEVVSKILADMPDDMCTAMFVVVHSGESAPGFLVDIFSKTSKLPVQYAIDREPIELGRVYVAPADRHLLIKPGEMRVILGPKENNFRPALDPLFRTAATTYTSRVIGVVLSGSLDDGTHGLLQIKRAGGATVVQSPDDASHAGMPQSAIERVGVDHVKPASEIASLLYELAGCDENVATALGEDEVDVSEGVMSALQMPSLPAPSPFICPECNGALWEVQDGAMVKYRCHVGHGYGPETLLAMQAIEIEQALWSAVRLFEEKALLHKRMAERSESGELRKRFLENAREQQQLAEAVRKLLVSPHQKVQPSEVGGLARREYSG
jgi:two-component system chemotaxis response regulator CheB